VTYTGENRNTYIDLTENLEEKGPLVRNRRRWEDNVCIRLEQDRITMGTFPGSFSLRFPKNARFGLTSPASQNGVTYSIVNKA